MQTKATEVEDELDATGPRKGPPYMLYTCLIGGILFARAFDLATQNMEWSIAIYQSVFWNRTLLLVATIASSTAAFYFKQRLPPLMAWLSCGVVGGVSMMLVNSIPGAVIGLVIGATVLATERSVTIAAFFGRTIVPATFLGLCTGSVCGVAWLRFGAYQGGAREVLSILLPLALGVAAFVLTLRFLSAKRHWYGWLGVTALFTSCILLGLIYAVSTSIESIRNSLPTVTTSSYSTDHLLRLIYPTAAQQQVESCRTLDKFLKYRNLPYPGRLFVALDFSDRSSAADMEKASRLPFVSHVRVGENCRITDDQFGRLNLRWAAGIHIADGTQLTANAFGNVRFSKFQSISLTGQQFGDEVIPYLKNTPNWFTLNLPGTRVTAAGLHGLDKSVKVVSLDLSDTPVDDDVFSALSNLPQLQWLDLSGTNITGQGIEQLPRSLKRIDLSNTQFNSKHLSKFLTPEGVEPTPWNTFYLDELCIRNTPFKRDAVKPLLQLANSLGSLKVSGLEEFPLEAITKIGVFHLALDTRLLDTDNIQQIRPTPYLDLHYDASKMTPTAILEDFVALSKARHEFLATQPQTGTDPAMSLVVENLELTRESLKVFGLARRLPDELQVSFLDARIRGRKAPMLYSVGYARSVYPELENDESSD